MTEPDFRKKIYFVPIFGQKGSKNEFFWTFKKKFTLVLSGNGLKRKNKSSLTFCKKTHVKIKFGCRDMAKKALGQ